MQGVHVWKTTDLCTSLTRTSNKDEVI